MKPTILQTPLTSAGKASRVASACLLMSMVFTGAMRSQPSAALYWDPTGAHNETTGGSGTWNSVSSSWWNGSSAYAWVAGSSGSASTATYGTLVFGATGQSSPYSVTLDLADVRWPNGTSSAVYSSTLAFMGDYILRSAQGAGTIIGGADSSSYTYLTLAGVAGATVQIGGNDKPIALVSVGNNSTNPSVKFMGGGTFILDAGARVLQGQVNGRITIGDINETQTTVTLRLGSSAAGSRIIVDNGILNIDGADVALDNTLTTANRSTIHIGNSGSASASNLASIINLNAGGIVTNPSNAGGAASNHGIIFGSLSTGTYFSGGIFNLNGGMLKTTDIFVRSDASSDVTAKFVFNGGTLYVSEAANQAQLNAFMSGFQATDKNAVVLESGGATINTGDIAGTTNGVAVIGSVVSGSGSLTKAGANTLELSATNTYTGETRVTGGALNVTNAGGISSSGAVTVDGGAELNMNGHTSVLNNLAGDGSVVMGAGDLTVVTGGTAPVVFNGAITGAGSLTKEGSGTFVMTGIKNYTGNITVAAGVLQGNAASLRGDITNNGILSFVQEADADYTGVISGSGLLEKLGTGKLTLTQPQAYSGGISIGAGSLEGNVSSLPGNIHNDGMVIFMQQTDGVYTGSISGAGSLEKKGAGTLALTQGNSYSGATDIKQGVLKAGVVDAIAASRQVTIGSGAVFDLNNLDQNISGLGGMGLVSMGGGVLTLYADAAGRSAFSGTIAGAGNLIKTGAGIQLIFGVNSFTGATHIAEGTLLVAGDSAWLRGDVTVENGAVYGTQGTAVAAGKTLLLNAGSVLQIGVDVLRGAQTLTVDGAMNMNTATVRFDLFTDGSNDRINIGGGGTLSPGGANVIDIGLFAAGTFNLGNIAPLSGANITIGGRSPTDPRSRQHAQFSIVGSDLILQTTAEVSRKLHWTGANDSNWDDNWNASGAPNILFAPGDTVCFDGEADAAHPSNRIITIGAAAILVSDMIVSGSADYGFGGGAIISDKASVVAGSTEITSATAAGKLVKKGSGKLTLATATENSFRGGVELEGGALNLASVGALGASNVSVTGAGVVIETEVTDINISGNVDLGVQILTLDTRGNNAAVSGVISGSGGLTKSGGGMLTITGSNSYGGTLAINEGVVAVGNMGNLGAISSKVRIANGAMLSFGALTSGNLSFSRELAGEGVFAVTLFSATDSFAFGADAGNAFAGTLQIDRGSLMLDNATASVLSNGTLKIGVDGFVKKASGAIAIKGLAFNGGTLQLPTAGMEADGLLTVGALDTGAVVNRVAMDTRLFTADQLNPAVPPNPSLFAQSITTDVRLVAATDVVGTGAFVLVDQHTGAQIANPSQIRLMQDGAAVANASYGYTVAVQKEGDAKGLYLGYGITAVDVLDGKTLILDNANATQSTLAAAITGAGSVDVRASGAGIALGVVSTHTGTTSITKGTLKMAVTNALAGSSLVQVANGAAFSLNGFSQTVKNISAAGDVSLGNATLTVSGNGDSVISGGIDGTGKIVKSGGATSTLTLSGQNRYSGGTTIQAGRLRAASSSALGTGAISIASAATLEFNGVDGAYVAAAVTGGGKVEVINSHVIFTGTANAISSMMLSGNSQVIAGGPLGSIGGDAVAVNVGAGSILAIAAKGAVVRAGSVTLDGGRLLFTPGSTLAVQGGVNLVNDGRITFGGSGVSHISFGGASAPLVYDMPAGMDLTVTPAGANAFDYLVVNQAANPMKDIMMTFSSLGAVIDTVNTRMVDHFLLPVAEPPPTKRKWTNSAWLKGFASTADYESTGGQVGHTDRTYGMIAGLDAMTAGRFLAGAYVGFASNKLETTNTTDVNAEQQLGGLYAAYRHKMFYINADISGGMVRSEAMRSEAVGKTSAQYKTKYYGGNAEMGIIFDAWKNAQLKPAASVRYMKAKMEDFAERGTGAMLLPDFTDKIAQGMLSLQASQQFTMLWGKPSRIDLSAGWKRTLDAPRDSITAALSDAPATDVTLKGEEYDKNSAVTGMALRTAMRENIMLGLGCDFEFTSNRTRINANFTASYLW